MGREFSDERTLFERTFDELDMGVRENSVKGLISWFLACIPGLNTVQLDRDC